MPGQPTQSRLETSAIMAARADCPFRPNKTIKQNTKRKNQPTSDNDFSAFTTILDWSGGDDDGCRCRSDEHGATGGPHECGSGRPDLVSSSRGDHLLVPPPLLGNSCSCISCAIVVVSMRPTTTTTTTTTALKGSLWYVFAGRIPCLRDCIYCGIIFFRCSRNDKNVIIITTTTGPILH
jgi:hypothetical protein